MLTVQGINFLNKVKSLRQVYYQMERKFDCEILF